jgi:IMP dehydrogenase
MDGVTDVRFCIAMGKLGGLGVINLEGVQTRYANPSEVLEQDRQSRQGRRHRADPKLLYRADQGGVDRPARRGIKGCGVLAAVSSIPQKAERFGCIAQEAGADLFVVQSTVSTVKHISTEYKSLELAGFLPKDEHPGHHRQRGHLQCHAAIDGCGVAGVLIGVGPGAACTSRGVLGLGVPQVTATVDCAAARDYHHKK